MRQEAFNEMPARRWQNDERPLGGRRRTMEAAPPVAAVDARHRRRSVPVGLLLLLLLSHLTTTTVTAQSSTSTFATEKAALTKLYSYTNGPYWSNNKNWLSDRVDVCQWYGISCTDTGYVSSIDLEDNKLSGTTPRELFQFSYMTKLNLRLNPIDVKFSYIDEATSLTKLILSDASVYKLDRIGKAPSLESLHLTNNDLGGTLPDELYELTTLKQLFLNYNKFTGPLSDKVSQLSNLQVLYLYQNQLSGEIPVTSMSSSLTNLKELTLSENHFTGTLPSTAFAGMTHLEILALQQDEPHPNRGLVGTMPDFANLARLSELYLGGNHFTGTLPATLLDNSVRKQEAVTVELINNDLTGTVPAALAQFDRMKLYVRGNRLTGLDDSLCALDKWMGGQVGQFGCDAILCPGGTYSKIGRQSAEFTDCMDCDGAPYRTAKFMGSTECKLSQWEVMRHLYRDAGGNGWKKQTGWDFADKTVQGDVCSLEGVTCAIVLNSDDEGGESEGQITDIDLSGNSLSGYVPTSIYMLPNLETLNLKDNKNVRVSFDGIGQAKKLRALKLTNVTIPTLDGIGNAKNITQLHLTYNELEGDLPAEFFTLTKLEDLFLSYNQFNIGIPEDFAKMTSLKQLVCYDAGFTGPVPTNIFGQMENLELLYLAKNQLTGVTPTDWFNLPKLEVLNLKENPALDFNFEGIGSAKSLTDLRLSEMGLSSLSGVGEALKLEKLHLTENELSGPIPDEIYGLTNLKQLFLNYNRFSGKLSSRIGELGKLEQFFLYDNQMTGQLPNELSQCTDMIILSLAENKFSGTFPTTLSKMKKLNILAVQQDDTVNVKGGIGGPLPDFADMEDLMEVYLGGNSISGTIPDTFLENSNHKEDEIFVDLTDNQLTGTVPATLASFDKISILLQKNKITGISSEICDKSGWMGGNVGTYGCDAILCPTSTASTIGRQNNDGTACAACDNTMVAEFYGTTACTYGNGDEVLSVKEVLTKFYHATDGPRWAISTNWLSEEVSICEWYGLECSDAGTGTVTSIKLPSNKLGGIVPHEVFRLESLQDLDLSDNSVDVSFESIAFATSLARLRLSHTRVSAVDGIGNAPSTLTSLHLDNNHISGTFPDDIFNLVNLQHLLISHNALSGPLPDKIGQLTGLSVFHVYGNELSGQLPASIGNLVQLTELDLAENKFTGTLPPELDSLTELTLFNLHQATREESIGGPLLDFASLSQISVLVLESNALTGTIPATLLQNSAKTAERILVGLISNKLVGTVPADLGTRFDRLILDLAGNKIDGIAPELCSKSDWMDGAVQDYGCDAILCPPGQFSIKGRQSNGNSACQDCDNPDAEPFFGTTLCYDDGILSDRDILEAFYFKTGGPNWVRKDNWLSDTVNICEWYGVNCTSDGQDGNRVEKMSLEKNQVSGTPPPELFALPELKHLNLKDNPLKFSFAGFGNAKKLDYLKISGTGLSSVEGIGQAPSSLRALHLTDNDLVGPIPDELFSLIGLRKLFIDYNKLSGTLSPKIGDLDFLEDFFLFSNKLSGQIPSEIGMMTNLKVLALSENEFSGTLPDELGALTNLDLLALQQSMRTGPGIGGPLLDFSTLTKITTLYLGPNKLTGTIPSSFLSGVSKTSEPIEVDVSMNLLHGTVPSALERLERLEIHLQGNELTGIAPNLCSKNNWQNGAVALFGCNAIMCPPSTSNHYGRHSADMECTACDDVDGAPYFGSTSCLSADAQQTRVERDILKKFYSDTNGPGWRFDTNWLERGTSICDWYGISCPVDGSETVEVIYLAKNWLQGQPPSELFELPNLKELHLGENTIQFSFTGIEQATNLERLNLDMTGLKSLEGVEAATTLKWLHARSDDLVGNIPDGVFALTALEELDLSDNKLSGELPAGLRNLANLKSFSAFNNVLSGYVPEWIGDLTNLQYLRLDRNDLSGSLPGGLADLTSLEHLDLSEQTFYGGVGLTGPLPAFSDASRLTELILKTNNLVGTIPSTLLENADTFDVISVDLRSNNLYGTLPTDLTRFERLNIYLSNNEMDAIPLELCDAVP